MPPRPVASTSLLALALALTVGSACEETPAPEVSAEPRAAAVPSSSPSPSGAPIDPSFYEEEGCESLSPPTEKVVFRLEHSSLDEIVTDVLPRALGGCVDASPSLLHRYRCLDIDRPLVVTGDDALPNVRRLLRPFDLHVERVGDRYRLTAPTDGGPCPDGG